MVKAKHGGPSAPDCAAEDHPPKLRVAHTHDAKAYVRAAAIFRAAGDVARLRLLAELADGEWCVSELAENLKEGLSTVSQRLRLLRSEGLVARRRDGKHIFYTLADRHVADLLTTVLAHASEEHSDEEDEP